MADPSASRSDPPSASLPWRQILKRTVREVQEDELTDRAAALTYYAVLSLFPALIVLVALLGVLGSRDTFDALVAIVRAVAPSGGVDTVSGPIRSILAEKETAGALLGFGLLGAIWTASAYVGAFMRACNTIYEVEEGRPFWKLRPLQIGITIAVLLLIALVAIGLVLSGPLAEAVGGVIGLGDAAVMTWSIGKWPLLLVLVAVILAVLYGVSPNVQHPQLRWLVPGGALAVVLIVLASVAFGFYVANFGSYDATYGSLGGVIVFLIWLWISNLVLLVGAELNAEIERARELAAGLPAEQHLQLEPRQAAAGS